MNSKLRRFLLLFLFLYPLFLFAGDLASDTNLGPFYEEIQKREEKIKSYLSKAEEEDAKEEAETMQKMQKYLPLLQGYVASCSYQQTKEYLKPEFSEKMATFMKNYFEALQRKGFSKEEAFKLATGLNISEFFKLANLGGQ